MRQKWPAVASLSASQPSTLLAMSSSAQPTPAMTPASSAAPLTSTSASPSPASAIPRVTSRRLGDLVNSIQPNTKLEPELEALLLELADEFVDSVTAMSSLLARQRHSNKLELRDVQHHIGKAWGITVPGYTQMDEWRELAPAGASRLADEGEEEDGEEERGGKARGRDFSAGVPALQRLKAFRKSAVSEGHKRRMQIITQAKFAATNGRREADAELNAALDSRKRKRSSGGGGGGGGGGDE